MNSILKLIWKAFIVSIVGVIFMLFMITKYTLPMDEMNIIFLIVLIGGVILFIECKVKQIRTSKVFSSYIVLYGLIGAVLSFLFNVGMSLQGNHSILTYDFLDSYVVIFAICFGVSIIPSAIFTGIYRLLLFKKDTDTVEAK